MNTNNVTLVESDVFLRDAARQVLAAFYSNDEKGLREAVGYLARSLDRAHQDDAKA